MLSTQDIVEYVKGMTYKPGWSFDVYEGAWEGTHIFILANGLPNSYENADSPSTVTLGIHSMVPPVETEEQLARWIAWRLQRIEVHEMREFLKHNGEIIFDPHAPGANEDRF